MGSSRDALTRYRDKRDFERTREPSGEREIDGDGFSYCVQMHAARRLHYDFRLELDGVLKSWAVPKGPSLVPGEKRLAVMTEDHPVDYGGFEGVIPEGEYGGGTVLLWDRGSWEPVGDPRAGLAKGKLDFRLHGDKLHGKFALVKLSRGESEWLLLKAKDEHAAASGEIIDEQPTSVISGRALDEIAASEGGTAKQLARARTIAGRGEGEAAAPKRAAKTTAAKRMRRTDAEPAAAAIDGELPEFVEPQLATLVDRVPDGRDWLHEIKLDGYRLQCRIDDGTVTFASRNQIDWTARVPDLVAAMAELDCTQAVVDGELVWLDEAGRSVFSGLGAALGRRDHPNLVYFAFDLLHLDGRDLRSLPQHERKAVLARLCEGAPPIVRYSEHVSGRGAEFFRTACELGVEGIVSKRADAPHRSGRSREWLKIKCLSRQELVIVGFTPPTHARDCFGSLVLAVNQPSDDDTSALVYAGRVGTGFTRDDRQRVYAQLEPWVREDCPLPTRPRAPGLSQVTWVEPELVAEIAFTEWTPDGRLRHPSFQGLREDKPASAVVRERPAGPIAPPIVVDDDDTPVSIAISKPDKVLFADTGTTKLALARYYQAIAPRMLPHAQGRPLMLLRCPDGAGKPCFYQKHADHGLPDGLVAFPVVEDDGTSADAIAIESADGLVGLAQLAALELHVWGSRRERIEHPDRMVLDLDPDPSVPFAAVVAGALALRDELAALELTSFVLATGGKGLHVVVPLDATDDFDAVKAFSRVLAEARVRAEPQRFIATASKARRKGKIFVDWLRNGRGATAVCPWSTRARPGAPVAVPLAWDELDALERAPVFSLAAARARAVAADPWAGYDAVRQRVPVRKR